MVSFINKYINRHPIILNDDECAIFGYGSLVNIQSMEKTLRHKYTGPIILTYLQNWKRDWNIAMPNSYFFQETVHGRYFPKYIVYLNVTPSEGSEVYGNLFVIKKGELEYFREREWTYDFIDVSRQVKDVNVKGGAVYTFTAKRKYRIKLLNNRSMAVRATYIDKVINGFKEYGDRSLKEYERTAAKISSNYIIQDLKDDKAKVPFWL